ncbi:MAG TPA: quinone-dependent dihydroorotate dehydrogenase [Bdellovibrionales bacterium]|nr:quinone-dependent dihydroorotate dehydrogenase [Bdellovibrionales bacterium]
MKIWLSLPPKVAHDLAPLGLKLAATFREPKAYEWMPFDWKGIHFPNRLGIAGGVDKNGSLIEEWWTFGPGFIEIGTVTPKPQEPNSGKIIDRDEFRGALWNKMGFPSAGVYEVRENLRDISVDRVTPIFANIGKNRTTENDRAAEDYAECIDALSGLVDAFVVNISSPNTSGLRELFQPKHLSRFLGTVLAARNKSDDPNTPVLLKLSPDLEENELRTVVETAGALGINGFVATNTTLGREYGSPFPKEGGVSGRPLAERSKATLRALISELGSSRKNQLIISAGGIMTPDDVKERLDLGADLVQVYTSLIYNGPGFFRQVDRFIKQ